MSSHRATFYLQLEAEYGRRYVDPVTGSVETVRAIKAVAITQNRPTKPRPGAVITKLTVEVPDGAFLPLRPEAIIVIPEGMTELAPIEVEAIDPTED